jgi:hypothetical protein
MGDTSANGKVGIGTASPAAKLEVDSSTTPQILVKNSAGNNAQILFEDNSGGTQNASIKFDQASQNTLTIETGYQSPSNTNKIYIAPAGNVGLTVMGGATASATKVGIGTTAPAAKLQVEEYGVDTTTTSTTATTQVAIHTFAAATFRSARFTVQITNSTDSTYHLTEILMIHDGTTPSITEYGTIFTGSAEATFDADINSSNVRLLATPATTDSMAFKVVAHTITT